MNKSFFSRPLVIGIGLFFLVIVGVAIYAINLYYAPADDITEAKVDMAVEASTLYYDFEKNEDQANKTYNGKVLKVTGPIAEITTNQEAAHVVILKDNEMPMGVSVTMEENQDISELRPGNIVSLKGLCTGYQGMEMMPGNVILTQGSIVQ